MASSNCIRISTFELNFFLLSLHNFSRWEKGERREEEGAREKPGGWPNVEETRNFTKAYWYGEKKNPRES